MVRVTLAPRRKRILKSTIYSEQIILIIEALPFLLHSKHFIKLVKMFTTTRLRTEIRFSLLRCLDALTDPTGTYLFHPEMGSAT